MSDAQLDLEAKVGEVLGSGGWPAVEAFLAQLQPAELSDAQRQEWFQFRAISAYQAGDRDQALERYRDAVAHFPDNAQLQFGLGQELEGRGQIDEALAVFAAARFPKVSGKWAMAMVRYCFLWGRPDEGFEHLNPVLHAIYQGRIIDDHFLYTRQYPFFGTLWRTVMALSWQQGGAAPAEARKILGDMAPDLADHDLGYLFEEMNALQSADFGPIITRLEHFLSQQDPGGRVMGLLRMRVAVLRGHSLDPAESRALIEAVPLTQSDFPWVEDVRTLALAELMAREGREADEEALLARFFERQVLLLEPEHLVYFHLLDYNEKLRARYIESKRPSSPAEGSAAAPATRQPAAGDSSVEGIALETYAKLCVKLTAAQSKDELPALYSEFGVRDQAHFERVNNGFIAAMNDPERGEQVMARYSELFAQSSPDYAGYLSEGQGDPPDAKPLRDDPSQLVAILDAQYERFHQWAGIATERIAVSMAELVVGGGCELEVGIVAFGQWYALGNLAGASPASQAICEEWVRRKAAERKVEAGVYRYYEPASPDGGPPPGPLREVLQHALRYVMDQLSSGLRLEKVGGWLIDEGAGDPGDARVQHLGPGAWLTCCAVFVDRHGEEHWVPLLRQNPPDRYDRSAAAEVRAFSAWAEAHHGVSQDYTEYSAD